MSYQAFRQDGAPTFYEAVRIPWEGDLLTSGLIFCFGILVLSFYIILPGVVGKERLFTFTRITVSLFIGAAILVSNFAMTWETAETRTITKYRAGSGQDANVTVGINIGFRGVNITLKGEKDQIQGETINYNENFNWEGLQGRLGFGPFAGQFNQQFRAAQLRGVPLPILTVAEYFTLDGEGLRWGRYYRQAGWYSHIALWLAFPLWILSNILFFILLRYGAYFLALTGLSMITSNIIWITLRNPLDLKIPFTSKDALVLSYGAAFWICLITGIMCVVLGIVVFLMDKLFPAQAAVFFGVDVLQDSENIVIEVFTYYISRNVIITMFRADNRRRSWFVTKHDQSSHGSNVYSCPVYAIQTGHPDEIEPKTADIEVTLTQDRTDNNPPVPAAPDSDTEDDDMDGVYLTPPPPRPKLPTNPDGASAYTLRPHSHSRLTRSSEHRLTRSLQRPRRRDPVPRPRPLPQGEDDEAADLSNVPERPHNQSGSTEHLLSSGSQNRNPVIQYQNPGYGSVVMTGFERSWVT